MLFRCSQLGLVAFDVKYPAGEVRVPVQYVLRHGLAIRQVVCYQYGALLEVYVVVDYPGTPSLVLLPSSFPGNPFEAPPPQEFGAK